MLNTQKINVYIRQSFVHLPSYGVVILVNEPYCNFAQSTAVWLLCIIKKIRKICQLSKEPNRILQVFKKVSGQIIYISQGTSVNRTTLQSALQFIAS